MTDEEKKVRLQERKRKASRKWYLKNRDKMLTRSKERYASWRATAGDQALEAERLRSNEATRRYRLRHGDTLLIRQRKQREENISRTLLNQAKGRAKSRGTEFTISVADVRIPEICPVLGFAVDSSMGMGRKENGPSLDRINNARGYTPDNVAVISWRANRIKNDATADELEAVVRYMRRHESSSWPLTYAWVPDDE